jgi:hypothetical protein
MRRGNRPAAPDYTSAALVMGLVNLLWIFFVLRAVFGLWAVLVAGVVLDKAISRIGRRRR